MIPITPKKMNQLETIKQHIASAWEADGKFTPKQKECINDAIGLLDQGDIRVAEPIDGTWIVNQWVKQAILLYFRINELDTILSGDLEFCDKIPTKHNLEVQNIRVVPPAVARYGSYVAKGCILMPSYVNIGAYVDKGSLIDTWATVGSCAQIGKYVHLSGGVGIGGVLEPVQANPVIIEDGVFVGSRSIIVEGVHVGKEAVIGAGVTLTASTHIIDVRDSQAKVMKGEIPPRSVVIPGTRKRQFPAGEFEIPCALIIGERKESTDRKTTLNEALREFDVAV